MDNNAQHLEHHRRITDLEEHQARQKIMIDDISATMEKICSNLAALVKNTSDVVALLQTARGLKSIVVWVSPFVLLVAAIVGIVRHIS